MMTTAEFAYRLHIIHGTAARAYEAYVSKWGVSSSSLYTILAENARREGYPC